MSSRPMDEFDNAKKICIWYRHTLAIVGIWPLEATYLTFTIWAVYCFLQIVMFFGNLFYVDDDLELITNFVELIWALMIVPKMLVFRFSKRLVKLLNRIIGEIDARYFGSNEEKELYLAYNRMAKLFFKVLAPICSAGAMAHYSRPFGYLLRAVLILNETVPRILPFRTYIFFEFNNYYTLALWWIYEIPMIYLNAFPPASLGMTVFLISHVCGKMSALAHRIRNIDVQLESKRNGYAAIFRYIAEEHRNIQSLTKDINDVFGMLFLEELLTTTVMIILTCHTVIVNTDFSDTTAFISYCMYTFVMFSSIYGSCVAGEYLITESKNFYESYYQCPWYDLPDIYQKQLVICMIGASKPVYLLGGGFYIFSLANFTSVMKTAMSYVSLLRTLV